VKRNRAKRKLRAIFLDYSNSLKDGIYIFVAKQSIIDTSHKQLMNDFHKVVKKSYAFKENQK